MEPSTVPSAGVDGSGKREGQGGDEDETHDLLHDQLLPDGSQGCEARRGATHLSNDNSRSGAADPPLPSSVWFKSVGRVPGARAAHPSFSRFTAVPLPP